MLYCKQLLLGINNMATTKTKTLEELVKQYINTTDKRKRESLRLNIVELGMDLVKKAVFQFGIRDIAIQEDLIQVGALGLMQAIDRYRPDKNTSFITFANYYIKGGIKHYIRDKLDYIRTPRRIQELVFKVYDAYNKLKANGDNKITPEKVSDYLNIEKDKIDEIMNSYNEKTFISLDQASGQDEDDIPLLEKIPAEDPDDFSVSYENQMIIKEAYKQLPEIMQQIIKMSFYEDIKQREIASRLNISQMQVSRLLKKALIIMYEIINTRN